MSNIHKGSSFDSFLKEEGIFEEVEAKALKRAIVLQIQQRLLELEISKAEMANKMNTSRSAINRLMDPRNTSVTLNTLGKAAIAIGMKLRFELL